MVSPTASLSLSLSLSCTDSNLSIGGRYSQSISFIRFLTNDDDDADDCTRTGAVRWLNALDPSRITTPDGQTGRMQSGIDLRRTSFNLWKICMRTNKIQLNEQTGGTLKAFANLVCLFIELCKNRSNFMICHVYDFHVMEHDVHIFLSITYRHNTGKITIDHTFTNVPNSCRYRSHHRRHAYFLYYHVKVIDKQTYNLEQMLYMMYTEAYSSPPGSQVFINQASSTFHDADDSQWANANHFVFMNSSSCG